MGTDISGFREAIENEIKSCVGPYTTPLMGLNSMMSYHLGFSDKEGKPLSASKGKYLRPLMCLALSAGLGGDPEQTYPAAAALELAHRSSLIFDDIQDNGKERNGEPTVQAIWGVNQAINAGFALSCYARMAVQRCHARGLSSDATLRILNVLEKAVVDLCWGQFYDISFGEKLNVPIGQYMDMVRGKTGSLFGAACEVGAICSRATDTQIVRARDFGLQLGVAFQIWDDYLGTFGDAATVGKTANDLQEKKRSFPVVLALSRYPEVMHGYLEAPAITPDLAEKIKFWMTETEIQEESKLHARTIIDTCRLLLSTLGLSKMWYDQVDQVLGMLADRQK